MAIIKPICFLLLAGGTLLLAAYLFQEKLIFYPQKGIYAPAAGRFADAQVRLERDGLPLHGWLLQKNSQPKNLLIYYGGNAEEVSLNLGELDQLPVDAFLLMNYRGYGLSKGRPSEAALVDDALWLLDTITARLALSADQVLLMGRSLGTGVAVQVAAQRPVAGLILVTPFDSLVSVARRHYPFLPAGHLLKHRFDSADLAPKMRQAALMLIAGADEIIPSASSQRLVEAWGGDTTVVTLPDTGHNDIQLAPRYWKAIAAFIDALPP